MSEELLSQIYRAHRYATGLQQLIQQADDQTPRVEATDKTGGVLVVLDLAGLPESIEIDYDWKRNLRPDALGAAVMQAYRAAAERRLAAWAQAFADGGLAAKMDQLRERVETEPATDQGLRLPAPGGGQAGDRRIVDPTAFVRGVLEATDDLDAAAQTPTRGEGSTAYGKLSVVLSPDGLEACTVDGFWASSREAQELTEAFSTALAAAHEDLARAAAATPLGRLQQLLTDATTILRQYTGS
jgi:hypothetical protein